MIVPARSITPCLFPFEKIGHQPVPSQLYPTPGHPFRTAIRLKAPYGKKERILTAPQGQGLIGFPYFLAYL
jgi:hypothetical protein